MHLSIWSLGKATEPHLAPALAHYLHKLSGYNPASLEVLTLPKKEQSTDLQKTIDAEGALVLSRLQQKHHLILLDERGTQQTSEQWATQLQQLKNNSVKEVVFLIGGAYGVGTAVRLKAKAVWSLGLMVMPHQLVRLVVAEQLYRACSILAGSPYHHA